MQRLRPRPSTKFQKFIFQLSVQYIKLCITKQQIFGYFGQFIPKTVVDLQGFYAFDCKKILPRLGQSSRSQVNYSRHNTIESFPVKLNFWTYNAFFLSLILSRSVWNKKLKSLELGLDTWPLGIVWKAPCLTGSLNYKKNNVTTQCDFWKSIHVSNMTTFRSLHKCGQWQ